MSLVYTHPTGIVSLGIPAEHVIALRPEHPTEPVVVSYAFGPEALPYLAEIVEELIPHGSALRLSSVALQERLLDGRDPIPLRCFRDLKVV